MATGIIAEYNPFHNGHKHQIECIKKVNHNGIVACMSGSITQRGELAILSKWQRARCAVKNGANLVIELPTVFSCRSAQNFAAGGVNLLQRLGIIDTLAFGTEYPDLDILKTAASFRADEYSAELQDKLKGGLSYGAAISQLISEKYDISTDILYEPNTVLALEYIKALNSLPDASIEPLPILRTGTSHNDNHTAGIFASGTAIRKLIKNRDIEHLYDIIPAATRQEIDAVDSYPDIEKNLPLITWQVLNTDADKLADIYGINEGLEYKIKEAIVRYHSYHDLIQAISTKRYSAARMQRIIIYILLNLTKKTMAYFDSTMPLYIRVLAFDDTGRKMLKEIRRQSDIPIITKLTDYLNRRDIQHPDALNPLQRMLYLDIAAANLRELACDQPCLNLDFTTSPIYLKDEN